MARCIGMATKCYMNRPLHLIYSLLQPIHILSLLSPQSQMHAYVEPINHLAKQFSLLYLVYSSGFPASCLHTDP